MPESLAIIQDHWIFLLNEEYTLHVVNNLHVMPPFLSGLFQAFRRIKFSISGEDSNIHKEAMISDF